jgi:hypothetical protein
VKGTEPTRLDTATIVVITAIATVTSAVAAVTRIAVDATVTSIVAVATVAAVAAVDDSHEVCYGRQALFNCIATPQWTVERVDIRVYGDM